MRCLVLGLLAALALGGCVTWAPKQVAPAPPPPKDCGCPLKAPSR